MNVEMHYGIHGSSSGHHGPSSIDFLTERIESNIEDKKSVIVLVESNFTPELSAEMVERTADGVMPSEAYKKALWKAEGSHPVSETTIRMRRLMGEPEIDNPWDLVRTHPMTSRTLDSLDQLTEKHGPGSVILLVESYDEETEELMKQSDDAYEKFNAALEDNRFIEGFEYYKEYLFATSAMHSRREANVAKQIAETMNGRFFGIPVVGRFGGYHTNLSENLTNLGINNTIYHDADGQILAESYEHEAMKKIAFLGLTPDEPDAQRIIMQAYMETMCDAALDNNDMRISSRDPNLTITHKWKFHREIASRMISILDDMGVEEIPDHFEGNPVLLRQTIIAALDSMKSDNSRPELEMRRIDYYQNNLNFFLRRNTPSE